MANKSLYQETLQLPKTDFPMRAQLPKREPETLRYWSENGCYKKLQQARKQANKPRFVLHDGPPYANGKIHIGTALNKILKDMVVRSRSMSGWWAPYVPGWDTHGLPIELKAMRELGLDRSTTSPGVFREKCADYARHYVDIQKEEFVRLGVWGDWDHPYLTLHPHYEAVQIEIFGRMAAKGFIYKDLKPVYWCADCETALAEAEIEYHDHESESIYVRFAVTDGRGVIEEADTYFVIWTTTPWTIPANLAICLHPQVDYVQISTEHSGKLIVARELLDSFCQDAGISEYAITASFRGCDLEGIQCQHPVFDKQSIVILGDHVTLDAGTGCVHTAPGHGLEDYIVGQAYDLPVFAPVDSRGRFTDEAEHYAGLTLSKGDQAVIQDLQTTTALLHHSKVNHAYPHCWRCQKPIIFRATEQWFASLNGFRQAMLDAIENVQWIPKWGIDRISGMVADRADWCISRQRIWGVPIPVFYCSCGHTILEQETIAHTAALLREKGSNVWFESPAAELLPEGYVCPRCQGNEFERETDIMDVWFDSGVSHAAVLNQWDDLHWPADLYLEGSDQHRGWFQSSLATAVAALGEAPYRAVLTHGFVVDGEGKKMSKSLGNSIEPEAVIKQYGADILRMWVASTDYRGDIRISKSILQQLAEAYRRIRNTARFILGNTADFNPATDSIPHDELTELDRFILWRCSQMSRKVQSAYANYDFHTMYHEVHHFCAVDLGGFYLDILKDILYCDPANSHRRRSAQTAMLEMLVEITKLAAPVLVFTAEEIWQHLPLQEKEESVHLAEWTPANAELDQDLVEKWERLLDVRRAVTKALEQAREEKRIGSSNEAAVEIYAGDHLRDLLQAVPDLEMLFITADVQLHPLQDLPEQTSAKEEVVVRIVPAAGEKCERCWRYQESVGESKTDPDLCHRCSSVIDTQRGLG